MRSLRKRKASSVNLNERSSSDDHSDGEFVPDPKIKSEDENPSNDEAVMTPKKKSSARKNPKAATAATKKTQPVKSPASKNCGDKKQNVTPDPDSINEADRPIPTLNGGYLHTKKSRAKIGAANKGNTPWNKGKVRSEEDKAKISAGVKARNRAVLLAKLEKMGWTEDQWWEHKKKLKLQREVERRKRVKEREQLKKESLLSTRPPEVIEQERLQIEEKERKKNEEAERKKREKENAIKERKEKAAKAKAEKEKTATKLKKKEEAVSTLPPKPKAGKKEISWKKHPFDERGGSYAKCPTGGPGGLICCAACCSSYNQYMNFTVKDFEQQSINLVSHEYRDVVEELRNVNVNLYDAISM